MIFESWITMLGAILELDVTTAASLIGLTATMVLTVLCLYASRGNVPVAMMVGVSCVFAFSILGWVPAFITIIIVLLIAGIWAGNFRNWFGGGGTQTE